MNKLKTDNIGGVSFEWDDWRWEQDGVREAFNGLLSAWGIDPADSFIISGCTSTLNGLNYDISEGFISFEGEIFKVNAHSVVSALAGGDAHIWQVVTSFDPTGLEPTKNAGAVNTYEIRRAIVVNVTPVGSFMPMVADTIHKKIATNVEPFFGSWVTVDLISSVDVVQNDASGGTGNDIALFQAPQSGSYLKYNITGNVVNIQFHLVDIKTTTSFSSDAFAIVLKNLPFNFKAGIVQTGSYSGEGEQNGSLSGTHSAILSLNRIALEQISSAGNGDRGLFNRFYDSQAVPNKNVIANSTQHIEAKWQLKGFLTAEID